MHKVEPDVIEALVRGMSAACAEAGIALVGGETAEMPAVYARGDLDVVGFVTGVVDRSRLLTGAEMVVEVEELDGTLEEGQFGIGQDIAPRAPLPQGLDLEPFLDAVRGRRVTGQVHAGHLSDLEPIPPQVLEIAECLVKAAQGGFGEQTEDLREPIPGARTDSLGPTQHQPLGHGRPEPGSKSFEGHPGPCFIDTLSKTAQAIDVDLEPAARGPADEVHREGQSCLMAHRHRHHRLVRGQRI